jgi:uncharacterized protein YifN (PemK superfamily)
MALSKVPERGRIILVDFEMKANAVGQEMCKPGRPCIVLQNDALDRGRLVTVVPLSTTPPPEPIQPCHHLMDHRSFREWPRSWGEQGEPRWAKCDCIYTVSLDRCLNPHYKPKYTDRRYLKIRAIKSDIDAVERAVLWALGVVIPEENG